MVVAHSRLLCRVFGVFDRVFEGAMTELGLNNSEMDVAAGNDVDAGHVAYEPLEPCVVCDLTAEAFFDFRLPRNHLRLSH